MNLLVLLRHAQRGDTHTTPTYDPSLSETGLAQARGAGDDVSEYLSSNDMDVVIHSSPYLRCLQTSVELAHRLQAAHLGKVSLKVDHALSEWLHLNLKFVPPLDNGLSLEADVAKIQSTMPLASNVSVDLTWNTAALGSFNSYGVSYYEYRESINRYIRNLTSYYTLSRKPMLIIVVTHGIAVNCLLQFLLNKSLFHEVPEAKISIAKQVSVGQWLLVRNCLGLANGPENTSTLSIPKDYETTFSSNALSEKKSAEKDFSELTKESTPGAFQLRENPLGVLCLLGMVLFVSFSLWESFWVCTSAMSRDVDFHALSLHCGTCVIPALLCHLCDSNFIIVLIYDSNFIVVLI
ncbi:hypothetical protein BABINDRAFT_129297 [Babjeviella inositovora NRRL Y-12698]|uniref:Phosphoglycerate mutase-like protein n=1 Tax=Babjeviella inositovora NRRL Y-12698 TaxID=984486 RepID=A0A1E3QR37_9ASCO|nr:uncharacterized protein BABINDRAFT_129297 [Babjeviella inositovora NRRL Y-12698]ODQ80155.1 hypothetical protein BABINDRAFT_129297 [Babjeviella inositovora NRRL Y-12698]